MASGLIPTSHDFVTSLYKHHSVDAAGLERLRRPIDDLILETAESQDVFVAVDGPVRNYERRLVVTPSTSTASASAAPEALWDVEESISYQLAIPIWWPLFTLPLRSRLSHHTKHADSPMPWWAPPDRFDARAATVISLLAVLAIISAYVGSLLSQTLSFAGKEFGISSSDQSFTAGLIRLGTPLAFALAWIADRRGRRKLLLGSALAACTLASLTALVPTFWAYAVVQALFRGLSTAMALLIGIVAVEESPAGSRAFVVSVISLCGGLGSGMVVWAVPLADTGIGGWRWIYVLALIGVIPILLMWRHIPETARFEAAQQRANADADVDRRQLARRLAMLGATAFLFTMFAAPASTLNTDYLTTVHDFSATRVSLFKLVTSTPIGLGVVVAGWIADRYGRKMIGAFGVLTGAVLTMVEYNTSGASLWIFGIIGTVLGGAVVPTLGVYGPELFGTIRRGKANGFISMVGVAGSVTGLFLGGWLLDKYDYGLTFQVLLIGPVIVAGLVLFVFPETANRTLEDINPGDK